MSSKEIHKPIEAGYLAELQVIQFESMGWLPLEEGTYLHAGNPETSVIEIVGLPSTSMSASNVLWLL